MRSDVLQQAKAIREKDNLWKSLINANTYTPETYPAGWEQVTG